MSRVDPRSEEVGGGPSAAADVLDIPALRPLAELAPGARGVVREVVCEGAPAVVRRLQDLGFTPGASVEVVRRAPLRDPVVYRVKDYEVCLRRTEAALVHMIEADR